MKKLPEITMAFWIMKICATTLGETAGDLMSMTLHIGYAVSSMILMAAFVITLAAQLFSRSYRPWIYWSVILSTSTVGTTMSDYMDRTLGLGYACGSLILISILTGIFLMWKLTGDSFSVEHIRSTRTEIMYWTAILFSNTLGTALGDFLADDSGLGFAGGALLIGGMLLLILLAKFYSKISPVFLFWAAFVLTRPFGATMGDVLTKTPEKGGLGLGTIGSSSVLMALLVALVIMATLHMKRDECLSKAGH
jgi:uncharacterized membrane-anchored protein